MKIDHLQGSPAGLTPTDNTQRPGRKDQGNALNGTQDSVSLSKFAMRIKQLARQVDAGNGVDLDRVNAIRQAMANGRYQISSEGIASGILNPIQQAMTKP